MPELRAACVALFAALLTAPPASAGDGLLVPWLPEQPPDADALPPGVFARLGSTRLKHLEPVSGVAASGDGRVVASASDRLLVLWDAATGRQRQRFHSYHGGVVRLAAGGNTLAAANDTPEICLINLATGLHMPVRTDDQSHVTQVAVSLDGSVVAAAQCRRVRRAGDAGPKEQYRIAFWQVRPVRRLWELDAGGYVLAIALSARGERLAELYNDGRVHIRDTETGREVRAFPTGSEGPGLFGLTFSPTGRAVAIKGEWGQTVVLDAESGKVLCRLAAQRATESLAAFAPDGRVLAVAGAGGVRLVALADGRVIQRLEEPGNRTAAVAFTGDGKTLFSGGEDGRVRVWDLASCRERLESVGHTTAATGLAFSPDGRRLASADGQGAVCIWDAARGRLLSRLLRQPWHGHLVFTPDGGRLACAAGRSVTVWDAATGEPVVSEDLNRDDVDCVAFTRGGRTLVCAVGPDAVRFDAATLAVERLTPGRAKGLLHAVAAHEQAETWADATVEGRGIRVWDGVDAGPALLGQEHPGQPSSMAFCPEGRHLAVCGRSECLLWNVPNREVVGAWDATQRPDNADAVAFSADGRLLAVYDEQRGARIFEASTGCEGARLRATAHHRGAIAFSPDGRTVATAEPSGLVLLWDLAGLRGAARPQALSAEDLAEPWDDLGGEDGARAYRAVWRLAEAPAQAVPFLRQRLRPAEPVPAEQVRALVAGLDDFRFATRQAALRELQRAAESVEPELREAMRQGHSVQVGEALGKVLQALDAERSRPTGERLRALRAVQVLEYAGTPESRALLERLAGGEPGATLTSAARAALERAVR